MISILIIYIIFGAIIMGMSIPLKLEKIPPHHWYGLRIAATLNSKEVWYKANKAVGNITFLFGISIIIVTLYIYVNSIFNTFFYSIGIAVYVYLGAGLVYTYSVKNAKKIEKELYNHKNNIANKAGAKNGTNSMD